MVRKVAEECMICGKNPCVCNKPAPKVKATRAPKPVIEPTMKPGHEVPKSAPVEKTPKPDMFAAMKSQAKTSVMTKVVQTEDPVVSDEDQFDAAVRALAPILAKEERIKYIDIIVPKE